MPLTPTRPNRVALIVSGRQDEAYNQAASLAVGSLAEIVPITAQPYNPEAKGIRAATSINTKCEKLFVLEDALRGYPKDHLDPWLINEPVPYVNALPGDVLFVLLAAGQNVACATKLTSVGDGTLAQAPATSNLYTNTADSTAVTNTTTDTALDTNQYTIPANFMRAGDKIRIRGTAKVTAVHSTDTQVVKVKVGAVTVCASVAYNPAVNDVVVFDITLTVHDIGATGHINAVISLAAGPPGTTPVITYLASTAIDTTGTNLVTMSSVCSVANAGNSLKGTTLTVDNDNVPGVICSTLEALDNSAGGAVAAFIRARIW